MHRQGPMTIGHFLVVVLIVLIVNAQLSWWIIYSLRESRTRLRLERASMMLSCQNHAAAVEILLMSAERALREALTSGSPPLSDHPPVPFARWSEEACHPGWVRGPESLELCVTCADRQVVATISPDWQAHMLRPASDLEVVAAENGRSLPAVALPRPFDGCLVQVRADIWREMLRDHRGRVAMMVSEGTFFAALLLVIIAFLWKTMRREVELERQHRNFLSAITHELKSPLAAMRLALETVLGGRADTGVSVRFLENALQDTERLQNLVQKVLEVTRYGRGHAALVISRGNLSGVVEDALAAFKSRAQGVGARLVAHVEPEVWVEIDEEAFAIVVSNLLENAVKYGGQTPEVDVRLRRSEDKAVLEVRDNGRGIPSEELPFIFNRFYRGGDEMTRTAHGTGLGLYLVRQIVTAHRGQVEVALTGPEGTTFRVSVPYRPETEMNE